MQVASVHWWNLGHILVRDKRKVSGRLTAVKPIAYDIGLEHTKLESVMY